MIGFFLMTEKGLRVLQAVVDTFGPGQIAYVVGAADRDVAQDYRDEIEALCRQNGIAYFDRKNGSDGGNSFRPTAEYHFAVSWRWLIRDARGLIVLHDSLLPKYRGFAPLPTALINGEPVVGVTALLANTEDADYDRGDILAQRSISVSYPVKIQTVISSLSAEYASLVVDLCRRIGARETLAGTRQNETDASYSLWRDDADYRIDWSADAAWIKRFIDSIGCPYKGASTLMQHRMVRVLDASVEPDIHIENRQPGKVVFLRQGYPTVVCGRGLLRVTDLREDASGQTLLPLEKLRIRFT